MEKDAHLYGTLLHAHLLRRENKQAQDSIPGLFVARLNHATHQHGFLRYFSRTVTRRRWLATTSCAEPGSNIEVHSSKPTLTMFALVSQALLWSIMSIVVDGLDGGALLAR